MHSTEITPNPFRADMHCHSTCSDGSLSPRDLVLLAAQKGLKALSITDHDTIGAYVEAIPAAREAGIRLLAGVELSAMQRGQSVHILGYAYNLNSPVMQAFCHKHFERRHKRALTILKRLQDQGFKLSDDDLFSAVPAGTSIGRPHIAEAMIRAGYVTSVDAAFKTYLGSGKSCYVAVDTPSVKETIATIHAAGGVATIAHPHLIQNDILLKELLGMAFNGIEVYYARFGLHQCQRWLDIAKTRQWLISGGSDFHGDAKPQIALGSSWVSEEVFNALAARDKNQY